MILPIVASGIKLLMAVIVWILTIGVVGFWTLAAGLMLVIGVTYHCGMTAFQTMWGWLRNG